MSTLREEYDALTKRSAFAPVERTRIAMAGKDRFSFLQRFCTNEIGKLESQGRCEAFITSVQGKTLGHVMIYPEANRLILDTSPGQAEKLIKHLDRYTLRDDVQFEDLTGESSVFLITQPKLPPGSGSGLDFGDQTLPLFPCDWVPRNPDFQNPAFFVTCPPALAASLEQRLGEGGVNASRVVEACRIEAGFPLYGQDITDDNLPQEVDRNDQAISFRKGCYLGQETVARIDALGHVNKLLRGLVFDAAEVPAIGTPLLDGDKQVGAVTSAAFSPRFERAIGLGYVRRQQSAPGTRLSHAGGGCQVATLPLE